MFEGVILSIKATVVSVCLSFTYLLLISFSLTSFRFHYLSGVIPLAPVPCEVFWGVGEGRARWSTGRGGPARVARASRGGQHGQGRIGRGRPARAEEGARTKKDRAKGSSTGALCTRFTLVHRNLLTIMKPTVFYYLLITYGLNVGHKKKPLLIKKMFKFSLLFSNCLGKIYLL